MEAFRVQQIRETGRDPIRPEGPSVTFHYTREELQLFDEIFGMQEGTREEREYASQLMERVQRLPVRREYLRQRLEARLERIGIFNPRGRGGSEGSW